MPTTAQLEANRLNAQKSTGPITAEGKVRAAGNSMTHGLTMDEESVYRLPEQDQNDFDEILNGLRPQVQPQGFLEEKLFRSYGWALFQADRARGMEGMWQDEFLTHPENDRAYRMFERITKLRMALERSAERARKEIAAVQHDRFCANQCNEMLKEMGFKNKTFSATLPMAEIRKHEFKLCNAARVAGEEIHGYPDINPRT